MDDDVVGRDGTTSESGKEMDRTASLRGCVAAWLPRTKCGDVSEVISILVSRVNVGNEDASSTVRTQPLLLNENRHCSSSTGGFESDDGQFRDSLDPQEFVGSMLQKTLKVCHSIFRDKRVPTIMVSITSCGNFVFSKANPNSEDRVINVFALRCRKFLILGAWQELLPQSLVPIYLDHPFTNIFSSNAVPLEV
jgi:hypothetical protein